MTTLFLDVTGLQHKEFVVWLCVNISLLFCVNSSRNYCLKWFKPLSSLFPNFCEPFKLGKLKQICVKNTTRVIFVLNVHTYFQKKCLGMTIHFGFGVRVSTKQQRAIFLLMKTGHGGCFSALLSGLGIPNNWKNLLGNFISLTFVSQFGIGLFA